MNNFIFYDTETTGIHKDFSQIIQCGSILTDTAFNIKGEQNINSRPLPWVIPQPMAMLTNKKINYILFSHIELSISGSSICEPKYFKSLILISGYFTFSDEIISGISLKTCLPEAKK